MGATGGQPPFDHRKIPETTDDIDSGHSHLGCLLVVGVIIALSMALFILGVDPL